MSDRPEKLYLSAPDADHERHVWFDPNEGGTEYVRADLYATLEAEVSRLTALLDDAKEERGDLVGAINRLPRVVVELHDNNGDVCVSLHKVRQALAARAFAEKAGA